MIPTKHVDLAILGGGCAGLSLARELAKKNVKKSVFIIEPRTAYLDDRSWCFWAPIQHSLTDWVDCSWPQWSFGLQNQLKQSKSHLDFQYQYIRSGDFYRKSQLIIEDCSTLHLVLGQAVKTLDRHQAGWQVVTDSAIYIAKQVIDTRPPPSSLIDASILIQSFLGIEILLDQPSDVDTSQVELMTDMRLLEGEFCFTYLLPINQRQLLVEVTVFAGQAPTQADLQIELDQLLYKRGWSQAKIIRTEYGNLPMGLPHEAPTRSPQPVRAGMSGGALRPSSGYGFLRIQRWAEQCAKMYCEKGELLPQTVSTFFIRQMDRLFLQVIKKQPALAPVLFDSLLGKTKPDRFIRFMNDQASVLDCLHIIANVPKIRFIKVLLARHPSNR
jgi:lycopene beta-cyclase